MPVLQRGDHGGTFTLDVSVDLGSQAPATSTENTVTVPGVLAGDDIIGVIPPSGLNAGLAVSHARVTAADTVSLRLVNATAGAIDPASLTNRFVVGRH
jgi:hypothetical protein